MTAPAAGAPTRYGTGLLGTEIVPAGDRWCWRRSVGPLAPAPFTTLPGSDVDGPVRIVRGDGDERQRSYLVRGPESAAAVLLREGPTESLPAVLHGLGEALLSLHAAPAPATGTSPGLVRLGTWLDGRARRLDASQAAGQLRDRIGEPRWRTLRSWRDEAAAGGPVRVHGAVTLGSLIPAADGAGGDLLAGEDEGVGSPELDLGWVVGEIVELSAASARPPAEWTRLLSAFAEGYGTELDPGCHRVAALRVALHLHDVTAYVGWSEPDFERYVRLLTLLVPA